MPAIALALVGSARSAGHWCVRNVNNTSSGVFYHFLTISSSVVRRFTPITRAGTKTKKRFLATVSHGQRINAKNADTASASASLWCTEKTFKFLRVSAQFIIGEQVSQRHKDEKPGENADGKKEFLVAEETINHSLVHL